MLVYNAVRAVIYFRNRLKIVRAFTSDAGKLIGRLLHDVTHDSRQGKLDPIIGRDRETSLCIDILSRRAKNNVILLGEPGVGKTAVISALAHRIVTGDVPEFLLNYKILSLNLSVLFSKSAEDNVNIDGKLRTVVSHIKSNNCILFIDEAHLMLSKGYDWSSIIKPELSSGDIKCIAATTASDYRKYFIRDKALQRRFHPLYLSEPTRSATIEILKGLKTQFEDFHHVLISDESIESAVDMSSRFIKDRWNPDKSIDLLDQACASVKNVWEYHNEPEDSFLSRRLYKDNGVSTKLASQFWLEGKVKYNELKTIIKSFREAESEEKSALKSGNLENASMLRFDKIPRLNSDLTNFIDSNPVYIEYFKVLPIDIANVVSDWSGIPLEIVFTPLKEQLSVLKNTLNNTLPSRLTAIDRIIRVLSSSVLDAISVVCLSGINKFDKQEIISALSNAVSNGIITIDLSEYADKHSIYKVVGPPPGYIGYEYGGQVTETIAKSSATCMLLENIGKCHHNVKSLLAEAIRKGFLTDSRGEIVSLANKCIILNINNREELGCLESVVTDIIDIDGKASFESIKRIIDNWVVKIKKRVDRTVVVEDSAVDFIRENDTSRELDKLKGFIAMNVLSEDISKNITIGVSDGKYVILKNSSKN